MRIMIAYSAVVWLLLLSTDDAALGLLQPAATVEWNKGQSATITTTSFDDWLDQMRVERDGVEIQTVPGAGRGLVATRSFAPDQIVLKVPAAALLRIDPNDNPNSDNDDWAGDLAQRLWHERQMGPASAYAPYLQYGLPQEPPSIPCRWMTDGRRQHQQHQNQLDQLQNATLIQEIHRLHHWRHQQARRFCNDDDDDKYNDFLKCLDWVCSRTLKGRDGSRQLVPFLDLANHAEGSGGAFSLQQQDDDDTSLSGKNYAVCLHAGPRGLRPGQAVTLHYGSRTVDDFLVHYGFCPDRCASDSVTLPDGQAVSWDDERLSYAAGHADPAVRQMARDVLATFPTTLSEDRRQLQHNDDAAYVDQTILQYRIAKKSLLASIAGIHSWS